MKTIIIYDDTLDSILATSILSTYIKVSGLGESQCIHYTEVRGRSFKFALTYNISYKKFRGIENEYKLYEIIDNKALLAYSAIYSFGKLTNTEKTDSFRNLIKLCKQLAESSVNAELLSLLLALDRVDSLSIFNQSMYSDIKQAFRLLTLGLSSKGCIDYISRKIQEAGDINSYRYDKSFFNLKDYKNIYTRLNYSLYISRVSAQMLRTQINEIYRSHLYSDIKNTYGHTLGYIMFIQCDSVLSDTEIYLAIDDLLAEMPPSIHVCILCDNQSKTTVKHLDISVEKDSLNHLSSCGTAEVKRYLGKNPNMFKLNLQTYFIPRRDRAQTELELCKKIFMTI